MKNFILALVCVLCSAVAVEAACCGNSGHRVVRRAPTSPVVRKVRVVKQRVPYMRMRGGCSNGRCFR